MLLHRDITILIVRTCRNGSSSIRIYTQLTSYKLHCKPGYRLLNILCWYTCWTKYQMPQANPHKVTSLAFPSINLDYIMTSTYIQWHLATNIISHQNVSICHHMSPYMIICHYISSYVTTKSICFSSINLLAYHNHVCTVTFSQHRKSPKCHHMSSSYVIVMLA